MASTMAMAMATANAVAKAMALALALATAEAKAMAEAMAKAMAIQGHGQGPGRAQSHPSPKKNPSHNAERGTLRASQSQDAERGTWIPRFHVPPRSPWYSPQWPTSKKKRNMARWRDGEIAETRRAPILWIHCPIQPELVCNVSKDVHGATDYMA